MDLNSSPLPAGANFIVVTPNFPIPTHLYTLTTLIKEDFKPLDRLVFSNDNKVDAKQGSRELLVQCNVWRQWLLISQSAREESILSPNSNRAERIDKRKSTGPASHAGSISGRSLLNLYVELEWILWV